jgi:hypothetical protein
LGACSGLSLTQRQALFLFLEVLEMMKRKYIWAYLDGKKLVEVIQAALDNNMMVDQVKKLLIKENPGHKVTFKVV